MREFSKMHETEKFCNFVGVEKQSHIYLYRGKLQLQWRAKNNHFPSIAQKGQ